MRVPASSPLIGKTVRECEFTARTGVAVIGIKRRPESGYGDDQVIDRGDTLVAVGRPDDYPAFQRLLDGRG